jgi:dipeptidyl aminopeptidase/acylaminoacyl peptidase
MRKLLFFAISAALLVSLAAPEPASFTIEQVLSAPFPADLIASPAGAKLAWAFNAAGVRNIWVAEPPDYKARRITNYSADDGQEILQLDWTPDARAIIYVRGENANTQGEYPNPLNDPKGVEQAVWLVSLDGGPPRHLGEGHSPAASPDGQRVAFIRKDQIWTAPLDGKEKATQLVHARGRSRGLRWSPDGAALAFVSDRGDHGFIGIYDVKGQSLRYLDASVDRDDGPVWSPDGKRVAFIRMPVGRRLAFGPRRAAPRPWSIRIADATTGAGRQLWKAELGPGSAFRGVDTRQQVLWAADDLLVFPWERDGWTHLYSVPAAGGRATLLTPGDFEVEQVSLAPGGREIVLSSNQNDIDRRHIWRVLLKDPRPTPVTSGNEIEWSPVVTSDSKAVAFLHSDARHPARPAIRLNSDTVRDLAPDTIPASFPGNGLVEPQQVIFSAADGMMIHGQLFLPPQGERHPAVVFFHGGSRRQMLLGWHYMYYYHNAYAFNQYLASRGYVVLSVNYRSGIGYGLNFREALNYGSTGASEFQDVLGAGLYLRGRSDVDPHRIGLWGGSYGGYLTAMGLARASDLFAAGVDLHGVHDWSRLRTSFTEPQAQDAARAAFQSSPMAYVKDWRSPVLLIHGDDDRNVNFSQTVELVEALRRQGVELEQLIFPDEVHDFLTHAHWLQAYHRAADFFDSHLSPR